MTTWSRTIRGQYTHYSGNTTRLIRANSPAEVFVIEVTNPRHKIVRAVALFHLAQGIASALAGNSQQQQATKPRFVVLLPALPPETDDFVRLLDSHLRDGSVTIVSEDGEILPATRPMQCYSAEQFRLKLIAARGSPLDLLKNKMIRRLGHFRHRRGRDSCCRYFYDGRLCEPEVSQLVGDFIDANCDPGAFPLVLYHSPMSPWLEKAVLSICVARNMSSINLNGKTQEEIQAISLPQGHNPFLIVDLIDTGHTVAELFRSLRKGSSQLNPHIVSVLANNPLDRQSCIRELDVDGATYQASYFMEAEQQVFPSDNCPMCKLGVPESNWRHERDYCSISSYDFWEMAREAGVKDEEDVPKHRRLANAMNPVINYPEIVKRHGAWLASKIRDRLEAEGMPLDSIVVCPDEKGSRVFTDYLRLVLGVAVIRIPREVIDDFVMPLDGPRKFEQWKNAAPQWYRSLNSSTRDEVIVMDEFNASGNTLLGVRNLLLQFGKGVLCYFTLNDLNPCSSTERHLRLFSLYEWQAYTPAGAAEDQQ